jgi:hypothetical protein
VATNGNQYVGAVGPNGIAVWRPSVTAPESVQGQGKAPSNTGTTPPVTDGGQGSTQDPDGNVYAAALFFVATCKQTDIVGNTVRADTGAYTVASVSCYQPYPSIGLIVKKLSATKCVVQTYGLCTGVLSGLTANDRYFVGPTGAPSGAASLPQDASYVQAIGFAVQPNSLFVQPTGIFVRRNTADATSSPPPGQVAGVFAPGTTLRSAGGRILHGLGSPPASLGDEDDEYLQTDGASGFVLWGPKSGDSGWGPSGLALVGEQGPRGADGPVGAMGPPGDVGQPGEQGVAGPVGADGAVGPQGVMGPVGPVGPAGADGQKGDRGEVGMTGSVGADGAQGQRGDVGPAGPEGPSGTVGATGDIGPAGQDGTRWFVGDGPPDPNNSYPDGSFYFDRQADEVYPPAS